MEVDFTAVGPTVVGGIGDRTYPCMEFVENSRMKGTTMLRNISIIDQLRWKKFIRLAGFVLSVLSLAVC